MGSVQHQSCYTSFSQTWMAKDTLGNWDDTEEFFALCECPDTRKCLGPLTSPHPALL